MTTALAFARAGAHILFCDIEERTLGLDTGRLADIMDDSVRAVVPIHYAGVGCDIDGIQSVLDRWPRAELVEDNAHGLYGRYRGRPLGSFGRFSALSFHETKNFICGEGGRSSSTGRPTLVAPMSCTTREPTEASSYSGRSTSTRGRTRDRRSGSPTSWRPTCSLRPLRDRRCLPRQPAR